MVMEIGMAADEIVEIYEDGAMLRDFVYIRDVVKQIGAL